MSASLLINVLLETAKQKLGGISACLNDHKAFASAVEEFDSWLEEHRQSLSKASELDHEAREEVAHILRQLTRLELQARHNADLVGDMQNYLRDDNPATNYLPQSASDNKAEGSPENGPEDNNAQADSLEGHPLAGQAMRITRAPAAQIYAQQNLAVRQASQEQ